LFFAFDYENPPESGYVSWFKTTPWFYAQAISNAASQNSFVDRTKLLEKFTALNKGDRGLRIPIISHTDKEFNIRINSQKGSFVYFPEVFPYDKIMHMMECWQPTGGWGSQLKVDIPISLKYEIQDLLTSRGITKESMYPEIYHQSIPQGSNSLDIFIKQCVERVKTKIENLLKESIEITQ